MAFDLTPLWISLRTAILATVITFLLGLWAARLLMHTKKLRWLFDGVFTSPLVLPPTVMGFLLLVLFGKNGPLGQLFLQMGIQIIFSWQATVIAAVVVSFPLMYRAAKGAFEQVDPNVLDAARTLGFSERKIFWRLLVPLAWPGVASGMILSFARALGEFGATLMIAGNIPKVTQTMPIAIYFASAGGNMELAAVWVAIIIVISFGVIALMNYWSYYEKKAKVNKEATQ